MRISANWLKNYVNYKISDQELISRLAMRGFELDSISEKIDDNVVVSKILKIKKHPNADKLKLVTLDLGSSKLEVVCGADNIEVEDIVPLALVGAKVGDLIISETKIRGELSKGMLCSERELGVSDNHDGILKLDNNCVLGEPINKYLTSDTIFDFEITPNRGDCLSHLGMAREVAIISDMKISKKPISLPMSGKAVANSLSVSIADSSDCPQYLARVIEGVKVSDSPDWLKESIEKIGLKSVNNIVDATNYVMFDLGQPLHAFDADKIFGNEINVRRAKSSEKITTIDNKQIILSKDNLIIADKKSPIAVAGVIGGKNTEISEKTSTIILEAAIFNPKTIRKSAKLNLLKTEASYRFERGVDAGLLEYAINSAANIIKNVAGGSILSGVVRIGEKPDRKTIPIDYKKINQILGLALTSDEIDNHLKKIGCEIENNFCFVPYWRNDINISEDLVEEVGRIYGYEGILHTPLEKKSTVNKIEYDKKIAVKKLLSKIGFIETMNYPFVSEKEIPILKYKKSDLLSVINPLQEGNNFLRPSLSLAVLKNVAQNSIYDPIYLFEIGNVFDKNKETTNLFLLEAINSEKSQISTKIEQLCQKIKIKNDFKVVKIDHDIIQKLKIRKNNVFIAEIDFDKILKSITTYEDYSINLSKNFSYRPIPKYPLAIRDLALIVDSKTNIEDISQSIYQASELVFSVELFDKFVSEKIGKGKMSLAFHIALASYENTLNEEEVNTCIKKIMKTLEDKFKAKLRE